MPLVPEVGSQSFSQLLLTNKRRVVVSKERLKHLLERKSRASSG